MNDFAKFLYELRKQKGMTQVELATLLGVTNKAVSKWETGEAMPETSLLLPLSRIFGVTVDELLDGKYHTKDSEDKQQPIEENLDEKDTNKDAYKEQIDFENIKDHLFTRGKDEEKTLLDAISGIVCAVIFFLGLTTYFLLGGVWNLWTPYWVIIPICTLSCGIIGIIFDLCNSKKRNHKIMQGENPFIGAICGIIVLMCCISYLILGVFFSLWHPYWIIFVLGSFLCAVICSIGSAIKHKNNDSKQ